MCVHLDVYKRQYHNLAKEHFVAKEAGKGLSKNDFTDEYKKMIDDLAYVPIAINTFTNNINTVEMGSTVTEVVLNWTCLLYTSRCV